MPAFLNSSLKESNEPNFSLIASARSPDGLAAAVGAHDLPEEAVVGVAAGVVADGALLVGGERVEVLEDLVDVLVGPLRAFERGVRLVDVGLVVLVVVDAHRLLVDVRLERVVVVGKVRYFVSHLLVLLDGSRL